MVFVNCRLREDQDLFLRRLPGSKAEHIRRAIDEYIQKTKNQQTDASASSSKRKGDESNG